MTNQQETARDESLADVVAEYLHWRKVNPHIKGGENYLKRMQAATASAEARIAQAVHDRDQAERQHAKIAAENMRLREAEARYRDVLEASQCLVKIMLQAGYWFDEPVKLAHLRLSEALDVALAAPLLGKEPV